MMRLLSLFIRLCWLTITAPILLLIVLIDLVSVGYASAPCRKWFDNILDFANPLLDWLEPEAKPECKHEFSGELHKRLLRDQSPVQLVWVYEMHCQVCKQPVENRREWETLPGGKDAMNEAWKILKELSPGFENSGSGVLIAYPPDVAIVYMNCGREAAVAHARRLLGLSYDACAARFDHVVNA